MSSEKIKAVAQALFDELVADLASSAAHKAVRDVKHGRLPCTKCSTKCRLHHPMIFANTNNSAAATSSSSSQAPSPVSTSHSADGRSGGYSVGPEKGTGGSTGIGSGGGKIDGNGNAFFDCLVCHRSTASNRFAPHMASCLGIGGSTRRGAARNAAAKARMTTGTSDRSSPAPFTNGSENGDSDNESLSGKKAKKSIMGSNGKKKSSPSKNILKKTKSFPSAASSPAPSFRGSLGPGPSRLGRPPKNAQSPPSTTSPANTVSSLPGSTTSSRNGNGNGNGMVGEKKPPPGYSAPSAIVIDDDDMDDDY